MRLSLAQKLALCTVAGALVTFAGFGYLNLRLQRRHLEETVLESADRLSDLIQRSTRYEMLRNDREALIQTLQDIGSGPGIRRVRIFNNEGRINLSTTSGEIGQEIKTGDESCSACHPAGSPFTKPTVADHARILNLNGERVLRVVRTIQNEKSCWNAACHAHPAEKRVLGIIDTQISLARVDERYAEQGGQLIRATIIAMAVVCAISMLMIWHFMARPISELLAALRRSARGDLSQRLEVRSQDELGEVTRSFNYMAANLAAAQRELQNWARTLEERAEQKAAELDRAHRLMASSERLAELGRLAATVAHEVNNPLFGILTYARLTRRAIEKANPAPPDQAKLVEQMRIIERESQRCGELMRELLTFARKAPRRIQPEDLDEIVERTATLIRHRFDLSQIELEIQLAPDLPHVPCDGNQIQQVVLGLLVNAAEAIGNNGGKVHVETALDTAAQQAIIRVKDNGPGIPAEVLPHIFEPFYTTKQEEQCTGLGLAVAHSILEQHGGSIRVKSSEGSGAEFTVRLPLEGVPAEPETTETEKEAIHGVS